ncbi:TetR/AcrR family transcriptional regulator [Sphingomonas sanxanigenens]|uniref:HTH tetR-type domain-containing protein n=1 Tax=Sphingomonas sanxanigenens DSM 19645 = NX02 TaxID=1123269 RepID=W0A8B8_9SPHN|nr:TetR/AcrR family transcriptional regulator [Sphingomonas sanxanigenens]AHE53346.1 hypothetical protein NX02_08110 [Sphingomonas sanxanigenens DSM 19645 = NX02]
MAASIRKARGRPRDADIDRRILDAARSLLAEGGFRALSFDAISQMAEVPRSMIYRRWPTKVHIANAIATGGEGRLPDVIDTEGLEAQVLALVEQLLDRYQRPDIGAAAVGVIAVTQGDRALQRELQAESETAARATLADIVARGQRAGLIADGASADALFDLVIGSLIYRVLFSLEPLPEGYAASVTRLLVDGLARR